MTGVSPVNILLYETDRLVGRLLEKAGIKSRIAEGGGAHERKNT